MHCGNVVNMPYCTWQFATIVLVFLMPPALLVSAKKNITGSWRVEKCLSYVQLIKICYYIKKLISDVRQRPFAMGMRAWIFPGRKIEVANEIPKVIQLTSNTSAMNILYYTCNYYYYTIPNVMLYLSSWWMMIDICG